MIRLIPGSTDIKKKAAADNRKLAERKRLYEAAVAAFHPKTFEKVSDDFKAGRMKKIPKWRASDTSSIPRGANAPYVVDASVRFG